MRKSMNETLEEIQKKKQQLDVKQQQLAEREKLIRNKIANTDRKERTRRLIQFGAIIETHLPVTSIYDVEALANFFSSNPDIFAKVTQYISKESPIIQAQRESEKSTTRRNVLGSGSSDGES